MRLVCVSPEKDGGELWMDEYIEEVAPHVDLKAAAICHAVMTVVV